MKENIKNFNYYPWHNIIRNSLSVLSIIILAIVCYYVKSMSLLMAIYIINLLIFGLLFNKYYVAKPINKKDLTGKYVYHCLSKDKLNKVFSNRIVNIHKTTRKWHNLSTCFKGAVYFHNDLRGVSFLYNHGYKYKNIDYVLIIPIQNLSENLLIRKIDGAIADLDNYSGRAKCIPINKLNIYKKIDNIYIIDILGDYFQTILLFNGFFMPVVFLLVKWYIYLVGV